MPTKNNYQPATAKQKEALRIHGVNVRLFTKETAAAYILRHKESILRYAAEDGLPISVAEFAKLILL